MTYQVILKKSALKKLQKLSAYDNASIKKILDVLSINPYPRNSKKLVNSTKRSVRVGNYRVIYEVDNGNLIVSVIEIDHRRQVYDRL